MDLTDLLAALGLVLLALGGGTFWSFSTGMMPGLARTDAVLNGVRSGGSVVALTLTALSLVL